MMLSCISLVQVVLVALVVVLSGCHAQQAPSIFIETFTNDTALRARQNVCDRYRQYDEGQVELRFALQELQLHPLFTNGSFFNLDQQGKLSESHPGLVVELMDELARRAGFTWRDSYGITNGPGGTNKTWGDLLLWGTDYYDVYVDWYARTINRLKLGISFPEGFYDSSYILVGVAEVPAEQGINLWQWLEPFETEVWLCILATILFSGVLYQILDHVTPASRARNKHNKPTFNEYRRQRRHSNASLDDHGKRRSSVSVDKDELYEGAHTIGDGIFLSSLLFTQHFQFMPRTAPSRLFSASMGLWALLISSNYTANLASFFVIENTPQLSIQSIDDAIRAGFPICVWSGTATHEYMKDQYPQARIVEKASELEQFEAIRNLECPVGITNVQSFTRLENQKSHNPDCNLYWVGRTIKHVPAGFGVKADSGKLCSSLVNDVLNLHLVEMVGDGFIDAAWQREMARTNDHDCNSLSNTSEEAVSGSRTLKEMAGTFVMHAFFGAAALVLMIVVRLHDRYKQMSDESRRQLLTAEGRKTMFTGVRRTMEDEPPAKEDTGVPDNDKVTFDSGVPENDKVTFSLDHDYVGRPSHEDLGYSQEQPRSAYGRLMTTEERIETLEVSIRQRQDELERNMQQQLSTIVDLLQKQQQSPQRPPMNKWSSDMSL